MRKPKPDYGLDAPGVCRNLFIGGLAAFMGSICLRLSSLRSHPSELTGLFVVLQNGGIGCLTGAAMMFASSRFGKLRARDRILDRLNLSGSEAVLDVGCGHGLLLIGAGKRLPRGHAVGIDLWSQVDQGNNSRQATLRNAALEGVAERVEVHDGDMRKLPFPDATFDAAVAHFAIHNIPSHEGRREAIREIVRVLKPAGQTALSDMKSVGLYADQLRKSDMREIKISWPSFWTWPPARTVTARKPATTA
ncbi:MAG TPA: class I SAM-dependent methyltransferase [Candidatus Acidoferrales bacterium]|nr:class I SAM-dependent methyltransferase [Candidatus Acidoferrales bacterium]